MSNIVFSSFAYCKGTTSFDNSKRFEQKFIEK